jgi:hypothetical protein
VKVSWILYGLAVLAARGADTTIAVRDSQGLLKGRSYVKPGD